MLSGLAVGCFANWAGRCEAHHLIIVRLYLDSTDEERKGGIIVGIEIFDLYALIF